jgi:hypothetical protein
MKVENIGSGHFGNGLSVWNRAVMKNGDYKKIAHISVEREITWYVKRIPQEVRAHVEKLAQSNPSVSVTQPEQKVFRS